MNKPHICFWLLTLLTIVTFCAIPAGVAHAVDTQIQTDGTLSGITALDVNAAGSNQIYTITEANGKAAGNNLFYSFSNFNIAATDTAWYNLNTGGLANVVNRVTGSFESVIDGNLKMTNASGGAPSFFFINPAGITFGAGASVNVPGSFYASTASKLGFSGGYQYNADGTNTSTLSSAKPESFGFLGDESGSINIGNTLSGPSLIFKPATDAAFVANTINIGNATLVNADRTQAGIDLQLVATGKEATTVKLAELPDHAPTGDLTILFSTIDASGNGSGRIAIRAGDVTTAISNLYADNYGDLSMAADQGIDLHAHSLWAYKTSFTSDSIGSGNSGGVKAAVDQSLTLTNNSVN